jgi:hypothetical protein
MLDAVCMQNGRVHGVNALAYNAVVPSTLAAAAGDQVKVGHVESSVGWRYTSRAGAARQR